MTVHEIDVPRTATTTITCATVWVPRGELVRALRACAKFAGTVDPKTPDLGLLTLTLADKKLTISATDHSSWAILSIPECDPDEVTGSAPTPGEVGQWRIDVDTAAVIGAVLTPPRDKDERMAWASMPVELEFTVGRLRVTEVEDIVEGRTVEVDQVVDPFPDAANKEPRLLHVVRDILTLADPGSDERSIAAKRLGTLARASNDMGVNPTYTFRGDWLVAAAGPLTTGTYTSPAEKNHPDYLEVHPPGEPFDIAHANVRSIHAALNEEDQ